MSNELAIRNTYEELKDQAQVAVKSGLFPGKTPEQALVIMLKGRELGIGPMQALDGITVIQGKATVSPQLMLALIYSRHPGALVEVEGDVNGCTVTMQRRDGRPKTVFFGPKEATAMGLLGKDNYKKQPATMFQWRAIAACARVVFPDIIQGMYTVEELAPDMPMDYETGEMIQQHPSIEAETRQVEILDGDPGDPQSMELHTIAVTRTTMAPTASPAPQGVPPQGEAGTARYSALELVDAFKRSIDARAVREGGQEAITDDAARQLAMKWRNLAPKTPVNLATDKARYGICSYLLQVNVDTFKGMKVAVHDTLLAWLHDDPKAMRAEMALVWAELAAMAEEAEHNIPDHIAPEGGYGG